MAVSNEMNILIQLATTVVKVSEQYDSELTEVKDAALRYKAECDQFVTDKAEKFLELGTKVAAYISHVRGLMDELRPLVQKIDPPMTQPRTGTPAQRPPKKRPAKKTPHARKARV